MNNKYIWLLVAAVATLTVLPGISCGNDDDNNPTDNGADDARDVTEGGDTGEQCPPTSMAGADVTEMRLRRLNITAPTAMQNMVLQQLIDSSMDNEDFIWLLRLTGIGSGTLTLRTGSGGKVAGTTCTYNYLAPTYPPDEMTMSETGSAFVLSGDPIAVLGVPLWSEGTAYPADPLLIMPLRELDISGTFSADHLFIGSYNSTTDLWTTGGTLVGKMTVEDAKATIIDALGMSLCGLISGDTGAAMNPADDCTGPRPWTHEPDARVGTDEAYDMSATIAASPVHIRGD